MAGCNPARPDGHTGIGPNLRYVKPIATGTGDGSSWANATASLQRTIDRSAPDDQVWVAAGVYKPTRIPPGLDPTDERNKTFFFSNGVKVFGGFDGTETAPDQRDLTSPSSTTLSGDFGMNDSLTTRSDGSREYFNYSDNCFNVITIRGSSKTVLDGLMIVGARKYGIFNDGSSIYSSAIRSSQPLVRDCFIANTYGPGIGERGGVEKSGGTYTNCISTRNIIGIDCLSGGGICSPTVLNCQFVRNESYFGGAASVAADGGLCSPVFINCILSNNRAVLGGGVFTQVRKGGISDVKLTGCLITDNQAGGLGGALYTSFGNPTGKQSSSISLLNCTINRNVAGGAGDFFYAEPSSGKNDRAIVLIKNSIIQSGENGYQSPYPASVSYSLLPVITNLTGKTNIFADSQYNSDNRLDPISPGVNAGDPNTNPKDLPATDLDGNPRFQGRIDIGAYERDVLPNRAPIALTHADEAASMGIPFLSRGQEAYFVDPEDKPISLTAIGLPASFSLIRNASGSYALSGTPTTAGVSSVTITAKDPEGLTASLTFQLVVDTAPVAFQLIAPTYNCQTGAFTFNTAGGDGGGLIEYQSPGITAWTTNPNQYVDQGLRTADDVAPFTLLARQKGVVVSYTWNLKAACGRGRVAASESAGLSVRVLGNPIVGETAQVAIGGADGQPLTLTLTDAQGKPVSTERIDQAVTETRTIKLGESAGVYLLRASSGTQSWTVRVVKP